MNKIHEDLLDSLRETLKFSSKCYSQTVLSDEESEALSELMVAIGQVEYIITKR